MGIGIREYPVIDYPQWTGILQGKTDLAYADLNALMLVYAEEIATLPEGARRLLDSIKTRLLDARNIDRNPPKIEPLK